MKTIYSLTEFREEVLKIANMVDEDYVTVEAKMEWDKTFEFRCYVNNHGSHSSETVEGCLIKLRNKIAPMKPIERSNMDVVIEVGETDPANDVSVIN